MNIYESIKRLKWYEFLMWLGSALVISLSYIVFRIEGYMTLVASIVGVTALIFLAKGDVLGQILTVIFSVLYAIVAYRFRYWGEMITYLGMTMPIAMVAVVTWLKNPYKKGEVKIRHTTPLIWSVLSVTAVVVTTVFYFILRYFKTPNLFISTVSIITSYMAASLAMLRSPYYALFYAANDVVLIILWILATINDISFLPMILCFICFLVNDIYGFINWQIMKRNQ